MFGDVGSACDDDRMASFETVVDKYDEGRPGYPVGVFDALGPLSGLMVLAVGAGTGIATRQLLEFGANVVALDPGAQMLARARRRSVGLAAVVGNGADVPFRDGAFDLVYFAQPWHWVDPARGCAEVYRVLRDGGRWAGWWSHARADGQAWFDKYWSLIEAACSGASRLQRDIERGAAVGASGLFDVASRFVVKWVRTVSVDIWLTDLSSHSYVVALLAEDRRTLMAELRSMLCVEFPTGEMVVPYETRLWIAQRRPETRTKGSVDTHALGYRRVDDDPNVAVLIATMEATSRWKATATLRSWERTNLALAGTSRILDVGCGLGEAVLALASDLGAGGEVVGIDASNAMLQVARDQSKGVAYPARFSVGDAHCLDEPTGYFDVARSERLLQWLADPSVAVGELARVLRPGGRVCLIDTDWSTLRLDVGDNWISAMVREAMRTERRRPSNVGGRLGALVRAAGFDSIVETEATQVWTKWDPDTSPAPGGCFSMRSLADDLVAAGKIDPNGTERFVSAVHDAARNGHFSMSLTMFAVIATAC